MRKESPRVRNVLVLVIVLSLGLIALIAPESQTKANDERSVTVTGCLQKDDQSGEYSIVEGGKQYGLRSESVDLSKRVGHKVTVTGVKMREDSVGKEENEAGSGEYAHLRVTNVKHISKTCQ
jgi:hypothetical protein